jgi:hypothetical protein
MLVRTRITPLQNDGSYYGAMEPAFRRTAIISAVTEMAISSGNRRDVQSHGRMHALEGFARDALLALVAGRAQPIPGELIVLGGEPCHKIGERMEFPRYSGLPSGRIAPTASSLLVFARCRKRFASYTIPNGDQTVIGSIVGVSSASGPFIPL